MCAVRSEYFSPPHPYLENPSTQVGWTIKVASCRKGVNSLNVTDFHISLCPAVTLQLTGMARCMEEHVFVFCSKWWSVTFSYKFMSVLRLKTVSKTLRFSLILLILQIICILLLNLLSKVLPVTTDCYYVSVKIWLQFVICALMTDVAMLYKTGPDSNRWRCGTNLPFILLTNNHMCEIIWFAQAIAD